MDALYIMLTLLILGALIAVAGLILLIIGIARRAKIFRGFALLLLGSIIVAICLYIFSITMFVKVGG